MKIGEYLIQLIIIFNLKIVGLINPRHAERAKRMLFLTSLAVALAREGLIKKHTIDSLNQDMELAKNDNTLLIGEELSKGIWNGIKLRKQFHSEHPGMIGLSEIDKISQTVIEDTPKWIRYDSNLMRNDIAELVASNAKVA